MEHQDFTQLTITNPIKAEKNRKLNTPNEIISKKSQEFKSQQKIIKTDDNGEIIKINKISPITSNFIKNVRNEKKMTQKDLSQKSNLPIKNIVDIEKGICLYNADDINKISKALGINVPRN